MEGDSINLRLLGVDISRKAVNLARRNQKRLEHEYTGPNQFELSALQGLQFIQADVLKDDSGPADTNVQALMDVLKARAKQSGEALRWDILISNPPYISPSNFNKSTSRSVRNFEPKLALVPPGVPGSTGLNAGDVFYPRLLAIAEEVSAKMVLFEVADLEQADRVANMAKRSSSWNGIQIWRDVPAETPVELTKS
ncbi:hypothetical protein B0A49_11789 [Cryomyces minteri]|uniref:Uncharacterized protein n=1 Tax=Cryomyces minteri TaxID=331657 RepID=A0A4U0WIK1_9PEZI|nr:hypothetical protein B0A49_11789 [Cryomyces minteri]